MGCQHCVLAYGLGALGFLPSEVTAKEGSLNLGLKDHEFVFQWVQQNIAEFGGDPEEVTVYGLSAGAHAVSPSLPKTVLLDKNNTLRYLIHLDWPPHNEHGAKLQAPLQASNTRIGRRLSKSRLPLQRPSTRAAIQRIRLRSRLLPRRGRRDLLLPPQLLVRASHGRLLQSIRRIQPFL